MLILGVSLILFGCSGSNGLPLSGRLSDTVSWTYEKRSGTLTVSGSGPMNAERFQWRDYAVKSLIIEEGITSVSGSAFYSHSEMQGTLTLPSTLTELGEFAFYGCSGLSGSLVIPDGVKEIPDYCFSGCSGFKGGLTLPEDGVRIGEGAFEYCGFTGDIRLPEGLETIGRTAFHNCEGLTGSLRYICKDAFSGCGELRGRLVLPKGLRAVGAGAFSYCSGLAGPLEIPDGTISIGSWAFYGCSGLSSLEGGKGLVNIRDQAFSGCTGLSGSFEPSESLTVIGEGAFEGCTGITGAVFAGGIESIGPSAFRDTGCTSAVFEGAMPDLYGPDEDAPSFPEGCGIEAKEPLGRTEGQGWQVLTTPENGELSGAEREVPYDWTMGISGTYAGTGRFADVGIEIIGREILITCNGRVKGRISFQADPGDEDQVIKTGEFTIKDLKIDELKACHGYGRCTVIAGKDASGQKIYFADENFGCDECVLISEELGMI